MTTIPPTSSTTARVRMKMRAPSGTRGPASVTTPTAKAMSVATGMPQPAGAGVAGVERGVDERRHDHAAEGGDRGERRGTPVAELAGDQLALDLEAGQQEEERHQPVVDERVDVHVELHHVAQLEHERGTEHGLVAVVPRRVGPQQRHDRGGQHDQPARGLDLGEAERGPDEGPRHEAVRVPPCRPETRRLGRGRVCRSAPRSRPSPRRDGARDPERSGPRAQPVGHASTVAFDEAGAPAALLVPTPL